LAIYQKAVYYLGVQIFNNLPSDIKNISSNLERFERIKKTFLDYTSFYTLEEYYFR